MTAVVTSLSPSSASARAAMPRGVGGHFPSATMRSIAPRARAAMSSGTVMW